MIPAALVAGIVLQRLWPGDFDYGLRHGGPGVGDLDRAGRRRLLARRLPRAPPPAGARAARARARGRCAFVLPGLRCTASGTGAPIRAPIPLALSPRLVHNLRTKVPKGAIVLAPVKVSYRVAASAPVYIVAAPVTHVADTKANDPYGRVRGPCATGCSRTIRASPRGTARPGRSAAAASIVCRGEGPARHDVLPARRRRRGAAAAQVRDAPAGARDRDARARAGRPEVDPPRRGAASRRRSPGCTGRATSARRAASRPRSCTARAASSARRKQLQLAGRRLLVPDENVSWNLTAIPAAIRIVEARGDRRRRHHLAAVLGAPGRRGGQARDRHSAGSPTCATRSSRIRTATPSGCSCA